MWGLGSTFDTPQPPHSQICPNTTSKVDVRLHGKENSSSYGARPVHLSSRCGLTFTSLVGFDPSPVPGAARVEASGASVMPTLSRVVQRPARQAMAEEESTHVLVSDLRFQGSSDVAWVSTQQAVSFVWAIQDGDLTGVVCFFASLVRGQELEVTGSSADFGGVGSRIRVQGSGVRV